MSSIVEQQYIDLLYNKSENTRRNYISRLKKYITWCDENGRNINQYSAIAFATDVYDNGNTINQVLSVIRSYLSYFGKETEKISFVPTPKNEGITYLSEKQLSALLSARKKWKHDLRNMVILRLMAKAGMRVSEVCGLKADDIDFSSGAVRIHGKHVKRQKSRLVFIDDNTTYVVKLYLKRYPKRKGEDLIPIGEDAVRHMMKTYLEIAGLPTHFSPHSLRHTFAIHYIEKGGKLSKLQRLMGHASIETTMKYLNYVDKDLQEEYQEVMN